MNATFGISPSYFALSGLVLIWRVKPGALPPAILSGPFGAAKDSLTARRQVWGRGERLRNFQFSIFNFQFCSFPPRGLVRGVVLLAAAALALALAALWFISSSRRAPAPSGHPAGGEADEQCAYPRQVIARVYCASPEQVLGVFAGAPPGRPGEPLSVGPLLVTKLLVEADSLEPAAKRISHAVPHRITFTQAVAAPGQAVSTFSEHKRSYLAGYDTVKEVYDDAIYKAIPCGVRCTTRLRAGVEQAHVELELEILEELSREITSLEPAGTSTVHLPVERVRLLRHTLKFAASFPLDGGAVACVLPEGFGAKDLGSLPSLGRCTEEFAGLEGMEAPRDPLPHAPVLAGRKKDSSVEDDPRQKAWLVIVKTQQATIERKDGELTF